MKVIVTYINTNGKEMVETNNSLEEAREFCNNIIKYSHLGFRVVDIKNSLNT